MCVCVSECVCMRVCEIMGEFDVHHKHSLTLTYHSETCSCSHAGLILSKLDRVRYRVDQTLQSCPTHMLTLHNFACELLTSLQQLTHVPTCEHKLISMISDSMSRLQLLLFLSALPLVLSLSPLSVPFRGHKAIYRRSGVGDDPGSPVYLTPYIKAGQIDQGKMCLLKWYSTIQALVFLYVVCFVIKL